MHPPANRPTSIWHPSLPFGACLLGAALLVCVPSDAIGQDHQSLIRAAKTEDRDAGVLRSLLENGVSVGEAEPDGTTALHWTSYRDDLEGARLLIDAGADVNATNDLGATPLWLAAENGSGEMVNTLLAAGADPNAALLRGETPLMVAARGGATDVVTRLLAQGAHVDARATRGQTALMWAAAQKHPEVTKVLIDHGADLHARSDVWSQVMAVPPHGRPEYNMEVPHGGNSALMFAARAGDLESAKHLIAAGANVDDVDAWGVSATVLAAHSGYVDVVEFLLQSGADPNAADAGFAALHAAVMRRDERLVATLLAHGADPNVVLRTWTPTRRSSRDFNFPPALVGATPFWMAARFTEPSLMRLLAEHGADPLFVHDVEYTPDGAPVPLRERTTALMAAVGMGGRRLRAWVPSRQFETLTLEAVTLAVELGVDINATDPNGRTALDGATALGYDAVVEFLVTNGATPDAD